DERAGWGVGALIEPVGHPVCVRVRRAPHGVHGRAGGGVGALIDAVGHAVAVRVEGSALRVHVHPGRGVGTLIDAVRHAVRVGVGRDRKSTRLNSSHRTISYAVFCLKKKKSYNRPAATLRRLLASTTTSVSLR